MGRREEIGAFRTARCSLERRHPFGPIVRRNRYFSCLHCRPNFGNVKRPQSRGAASEVLGRLGWTRILARWGGWISVNPGQNLSAAIFFLTKKPIPTTYCGNVVCDHKLWFYTQTPRLQAKEGKSYGSKEGKEKEEIRNEPVLGFLLSPGPLPQAGLFVVCRACSTAWG